MSYLSRMLLPDEQIEYSCHIHWIIFGPFILLVLLFIAVITYNFLYLHNAHVYLFLKFYIGIAFLFFLRHVMQYVGTQYSVTKRRVILKTGIFVVHIEENLINRIEDVKLQQSIIGGLLGYGHCRIIGTGGTKVFFPYVPRPFKFQRIIQSLIYHPSDQDK